MKPYGFLRGLAANDALNFQLSNRLPRAWMTRLVGRLSRIERPWLRDASIALWRQFTDLDLSEAEDRPYRSLHDVFVRRLKPGARPIDPDRGVLVSPCDAIVGTCGAIEDGGVYQAKGMSYRLEDLLGSVLQEGELRHGVYVTLRLTSAMYHHFHAPADGRVEAVHFIPGDVWNVNPPTLARVPRLFCRNERAALRFRLADDGALLWLVPVAAVLVASLRLLGPGLHLHLDYDGPNDLACDWPLARGEEMGWFEHGSTILLFAPPGFELAPGIVTGRGIRMGEALLRRTGTGGPAASLGDDESRRHLEVDA